MEGVVHVVINKFFLENLLVDEFLCKEISRKRQSYFKYVF